MSLTTDINAEVASHVINPKNYGKLDDANAIGIAKDVASSAYVIMYLNIENNILSEVKFATSGNQDTIALGSMLSEMIQEDSLDNIDKAVTALEEQVKQGYNALPSPQIHGEEVEAISTAELDNASMVLSAYRAALRHYQRAKEGIIEDDFTINISKTCPYSQSDCIITS